MQPTDVFQSRRTIGFALIVCTLSMTPLSSAQTLVWSDEFDGAALNTNNWDPMIGNGAEYGNAGWGNNELEYYTGREENVFVADGYLHIVARAESYAGYDYTSARIRSQGKQEFTYGRMEARIKLPEGGPGIWPAFWMLPTNSPYGGWAASGEIDILETINYPGTAYGTLHYGGGWPNNVHSGGSITPGYSLGNDFHVYAIEWEEDEIRWYFDNTHYYTLTSDTWYSENSGGNNRAPFDVPFHFLLNIAVGGNWPGYPDGTTPFPQEMLVDYVRVYDINITKPEVTITAPADGASLASGPIEVTATVTTTEGTIIGVVFYANEQVIGQDATAPYSITWEASEGCYQLEAQAVNTVGGNNSDTISVEIDGACIGDPYLGYPAAIPGVVEVENYDNGGEGVAYHDCDTSNNGGAYRSGEGVDLEDANGGGYNIGWMCATEWANYVVEVAQSGYYSVTARIASNGAGGTLALEFDDVDVTGDIAAPSTGGWQSWIDVSGTMYLYGGAQVMRFVNTGSGEYNLDRLTFTYHADHDYDFDSDVDADDWTTFNGCFTGPETSSTAGSCSGDAFEHSDVDDDNDTDMFDFAVLQESTNAS